MVTGWFTATHDGGTDDRAKVMHLSANGLTGTATILAIRETGVVVGTNPQCEIELRVVVGSGAPYLALARQTLAPVAIPHFQPGREVPVKVDRSDPQTVVIA